MRQHFTEYTEIANVYGVSRQAATKWTKADDFPNRTQHGWPRNAVATWVDAKNERARERDEAAGGVQEKVRLECVRLRVAIDREREKLEQEKIETQRVSGLLHSVAECEKNWDRAGATLRATVDSWGAHQTAKHPEHRELIDDLCATFLKRLEVME